MRRFSKWKLNPDTMKHIFYLDVWLTEDELAAHRKGNLEFQKRLTDSKTAANKAVKAKKKEGTDSD